MATLASHCMAYIFMLVFLVPTMLHIVTKKWPKTKSVAKMSLLLNSGGFGPGLQSSTLKLDTCYMMGTQGMRYISFYTSNQFTCTSVVLCLFILM